MLSDTNTATTQTFVNALQATGLTVTTISGGIYTYSGTPSAATFGVVVLLVADYYSSDMALAGQQSIVNAQQTSGTGVVIMEWAGFHVQNSRWTTLGSLLLAPRVTGATGSMTFTLNSGGHPIWNGLPSSFTMSTVIGCSTLNTIASGSVLVASSTSTCAGPGVVVRPCSGSTGRVVQTAHAGHYSIGASFNWGNDPNLLLMTTNCVRWAAQLI